jgi:hypothetical protein
VKEAVDCLVLMCPFRFSGWPTLKCVRGFTDDESMNYGTSSTCCQNKSDTRHEHNDFIGALLRASQLKSSRRPATSFNVESGNVEVVEAMESRGMRRKRTTD